MKHVKWVLLTALLAFAASGMAWADRGHFHGGHFRGHVGVGVYLGGWPWYYGPYSPPYAYYPPYSYYPPAVVAPSAPPVYVERPVVQEPPAPQAAAPARESWWYYCEKTQAYYPTAKECPAGWRKVAPRPSN
jgi:hypothetical protein